MRSKDCNEWKCLCRENFRYAGLVPGVGEVKSEYRILMGKQVGSLRRWDNNIKMDLSVIVKLGVK